VIREADPQGSLPLRPDRRRADPWLLALASLLVQVPFLDRGLSFWDEGSILAIADGLRRGGRLYADHVTPVAPLTYELLAGLLWLFGPSLWPGRILQALVLCACVLVAWAILRSLVGRGAAFAGAFALVALKPLGFPLWTIANYSQIAMLGCLAVVLCLVRFLPAQRSAWLFLAGLGIGMTGITKQNLGAMVGAVVAATVTVDWLRGPERRVGALLRRATLLFVGAALVVGGTALAYALRGTLGDLYERVVRGSLYLTQPYWVPLPGFELWSLRPEEIARRVFSYFPSPLFDLVTEGRLDPGRRLLFLGIEHLVKLAYYLPVLGLLLASVSLARGLRSGELRGPWSQRLAIVVFAAASWSSMLYRADWTHLMNVYPALLLLAALLLARASGRSSGARAAALACVGVWMGAGAAMSAVVFAATPTPVETPRGRIFALPSQAEEVGAVLGDLAGRPPGERVLFLRTDPLYYFLADRPVPVPFDLLVPGYLTPDDDAALAERLREIDRIVYDPAWIPTMPTPIAEYAPRSRAALAGGFEIERILTANAFVLAPRPAALRPVEHGVVDLWERFPEGRAGAPGEAANPFEPRRDGGFHRAHWIAYRVVASALPGRGRPVCFARSHRPAPGESVAARPVMSPALWIWARRKPDALRVRFEIAARTRAGARVTLYDEEWPASPRAEDARASLDGFAEEPVELDFCMELAHGPRLGVVAGWAEPRIVGRAP
jgi:4-amino-4-deoxy-L-arabinose transferase-like glycosyltransferase